MASSSYAKFDCPVAHQNLSLLATAHDCETVFYGLENNQVCLLGDLTKKLSTIKKFMFSL